MRPGPGQNEAYIRADHGLHQGRMRHKAGQNETCITMPVSYRQQGEDQRQTRRKDAEVTKGSTMCVMLARNIISLLSRRRLSMSMNAV